MGYNWVEDIAEMHGKYNFHDKIKDLNKEQLLEFLKFRANFLREELNEIDEAIENNDMDGVVDGLIDLNVVSIGTLDLLQIYSHEAWDEVHKANMNKEVGIKEERPNPFGFPDLIKPNGWKAPSHKKNLGLLKKIHND